MNKQRQQAKDKAKEMLTKYLPRENAQLFGRIVGHVNNPRASMIAHRHSLYVIDGIRDGQGRGDARVVNVNLYVSNLLGHRLDKTYNVVTSESLQDIASAVGQALGYSVKFWSA